MDQVHFVPLRGAGFPAICKIFQKALDVRHLAGYASSCAHTIMCTGAHGAVCGRTKNQKQGDFHFSFFALRFFARQRPSRGRRDKFCGKMRKMRQSVHGNTRVRACDICGNGRQGMKQKCEKCDKMRRKCDEMRRKCDKMRRKCDGNASAARAASVGRATPSLHLQPPAQHAALSFQQV